MVALAEKEQVNPDLIVQLKNKSEGKPHQWSLVPKRYSQGKVYMAFLNNEDTDSESILYVGPNHTVAKRYCSIAIRKPLHVLGSWELQDVPTEDYINTTFKTSIQAWTLNCRYGGEQRHTLETRYVKDETSIDVTSGSQL